MAIEQNNSWLSQALRGQQETPEQVRQRQMFNEQMSMPGIGGATVPQAEALRNTYYGERGSRPEQDPEILSRQADLLAQRDWREMRGGGSGLLGWIGGKMMDRNKDERINALREQHRNELEVSGLAAPKEFAKAELNTYLNPQGNEVMLNVDEFGRVFNPASGQPVDVSQGYRELPKGSLVNVNNSDPQSFQEMMGSEWERLEEARSTADTGLQNIESLQQFVEYSRNPATAEGELAPFVNTFKNVAASIGMDMDGLTEETLMQSVTADLVRQMIEQLGGSRGVTDKEREVLQQSLPNINRSRAAREAVAEMMMNRQYQGLDEYSSYLDQAKQLAADNNMNFFMLQAPNFREYQQRVNALKDQFPDASEDLIRESLILEDLGAQ